MDNKLLSHGCDKLNCLFFRFAGGMKNNFLEIFYVIHSTSCNNSFFFSLSEAKNNFDVTFKSFVKDLIFQVRRVRRNKLSCSQTDENFTFKSTTLLPGFQKPVLLYQHVLSAR